MASSTDNVKIGVCKVMLGPDGTALDLGYTKGGVEVAVTTDTYAVTVDQFGESEINEYIQKRSVKVTVPLAETTLDNLEAIMPGASRVTDSVDNTKERTEVTNGVGTDLLSVAQQLRLHPVSLPDSDESEDFVIPKAATAGGLQFAYKIDEERVFNAEFTGYPDNATLDANGDSILFMFGDTTATA